MHCVCLLICILHTTYEYVNSCMNKEEKKIPVLQIHRRTTYTRFFFLSIFIPNNFFIFTLQLYFTPLGLVSGYI